MPKLNNLHKLGLLLPVMLFSIITLSNGGFGNGAYGNLYLQPTIPNFPSSSSFGSLYLAAAPMHFAPTYTNYYSRPSFVGFTYNNYYRPMPSYSYSPGLVRFETRSYLLPAESVYTTPTRALFNVNYAYSNVGKLW